MSPSPLELAVCAIFRFHLGHLFSPLPQDFLLHTNFQRQTLQHASSAAKHTLFNHHKSGVACRDTRTEVYPYSPKLHTPSLHRDQSFCGCFSAEKPVPESRNNGSLGHGVAQRRNDNNNNNNNNNNRQGRTELSSDELVVPFLLGFSSRFWSWPRT